MPDVFWRCVTRREPCPICGKADWCIRSSDRVWAICRRIDNGVGKHKVDASGADYWVYQTVERPGITAREPEPPAVTQLTADVATLDRVYSMLLTKLVLSEIHRRNLRIRGLPDSEIDRRHYGTLPASGRTAIARSIVQQFGRDICAKMPGLHVQLCEGRERWTILGAAGLIIPVRDTDSRIVALKVRRDHPGDRPKYLYISSKGKNGVGPGAPAHIPLYDGGNHDTVRITEGELKADIATCLSGVLTISVPGVSAWRAALPVLKQLGAKIVRVAFDADSAHNPHVANALSRTVEALHEAGFETEVEQWPLEQGKGIDDLLLQGKSPTITEPDGIPQVNCEAAQEPVAEGAIDARTTVSKLSQQADYDAKSVVRDALTNVDIMGALALLSEDNKPAFEALMLELIDKGAKAKEVDALRRSVLAEKRRKSKTISIVKPGDHVVLPKVRDILSDAPVTDDAVVPPGWYIHASGVSRIRASQGGVVADVPVAPAPVLITARYFDTIDGTEHLRLAWFKDRRWQHHTCKRGVIATARLIVELADNGLPVTSSTAPLLVEYLADYEAANMTNLPRLRVSHQMGWQGAHGYLGFLWGNELIAADRRSVQALDPAGVAPEDWKEDWVAFHGRDSGDEQIADGLTCAGILEQWTEAFKQASIYPRVMVGLYASLAPPLLMILGASNFVVDLCGATSTGKTTVLRLAASCCGVPDESAPAAAIGSWDATRVFIERASSALQSLPLILDDTKRAKRKDIVAQTLYDVTSGRGRQRGSPRGLSRTGNWRTVMISSGEAPAVSFTEDGGTRARVLTLWGPPFYRADDITMPVVRSINTMVAANYGHAGPLFVQFLLRNRHKWPEWKSEYLRLVDEYSSKAGSSAVGGRIAAYVAVLSITARLFHEALDMPEENLIDPLPYVFEQLLHESEEADVAARALTMVMGWTSANSHTFWGRHDSFDGKIYRPARGWSGRWEKDDWHEVGFFPHVLKKVLEEMGFEPDPVIRIWCERDWIDRGDGNHVAKKRSVEGSQVRLVVIRKEACDQVMG